MRTKIMQLFFLLCFLCGAMASDLNLPLNGAKRLALEQNEALQTAKNQYLANLARIKQSEAKLEPQIGMDLKPSTNIGDNVSLRTQISFSFSQPNPSSPELVANLKTNQLDLQIANRSLKEAQRQLLWQVETAYFNLLKAEQLLVASTEGVRRAESQLKTAELQEEVGTGTRLDVMRMQLALSRSKQGQLEAQNNVRKVSSQLALLLGLPAETRFVPSKPEAKVEIPPLEEAFALLANRSEVMDLQAAVQKAELAVEQAQRQSEMKLSLVSNYNKGWGDLSLGVDKYSFSGNLALQNRQSQSPGWDIGVQASWKLADGGGAAAAVEEAELLLASHRGQLKSKNSDLEQELCSFYWDLEAAEAKLKTSAINLNTTKEAWDVAKLKFDHDAGSASELLDVEVSLVEAQTEYINASFDYLSKQRQLLYNLCLEGEV